MRIQVQIRVQHFRSKQIRMRIRILIQGFDDQKRKKFTAENVFVFL
jgi:hypothetical protein